MANLTEANSLNFTRSHLYGNILESKDFSPCANTSFNVSSGELVTISANTSEVKISNQNFTAKLTNFDIYYERGVIHTLDNSLGSLATVCNTLFSSI